MSIARADMVLLLPLAVVLAAGVLSVLADTMHWRKVGVAISAFGLLSGSSIAFWLSVEKDPQLVSELFLAGGGFSAVAGVMFALAGVAIVGGWDWFTSSRMGTGAAALVVFVGAASVTLSSAGDFLLVVISLEALAICGYALTAQARTERSAEASVKYVIQGSVATGLLLLGFAVLFGVYGARTGLYDIAVGLAEGPGEPSLAALGLIVAAFAYKLGAFPFHSWAPDVFETAPHASAAAMASVPKIGAVTAAVVVFGVAFGTVDTERLPTLWLVMAAGSIVFGNLAALKQTSYTRMLGYSGIAQIGYVLVGLGVAESSGEISAVLLLVCAYGMGVSAAFMGAEAVRAIRPEWDGSIAGLAGLGRKRPVLGVSMAVALFSLTGIPLTAGFWGKFGVFGYALSAESDWIVGVAIVGILGSVVSFGYYGAVLRALYFDSAGDGGGDATEDSGSRFRPAELATTLLGASILAVGLVPLMYGLEWLNALFSII